MASTLNNNSPAAKESFHTINDINVLICSANIGNKAPTQESLREWIPADGLMKDVLLNNVGTTWDIELQNDEGYFDIIAIGMQEASFEVINEFDSGGRLKSNYLGTGASANSEISTEDEDVEEETQEQSTSVRAVADTLGAVATATAATAHNATKKLIKQAVVKPGKDIRSALGTVDGTNNNLLYQTATELYGMDTTYLRMLLKDRCPSYQISVDYLRGEMRLFVLVRNNVHPEVSNIDYNAKNTGIGDLLANKGGIVATLTLRGTKFGFVTAHLEAHEGIKHYENRCENIAEILGGAKVGPRPKYHDISLYAHHTFVFGDLNFRVDLRVGNLPELSSMMTHGDKVDYLQKKIDMEEWDYLNSNDELCKALRDKECLVGFQTLPCNFPPTFKVKREAGLVYNPQRCPSYTDRILWKSLDGIDRNVRPLSYHPCLGFLTSDHKPIRGAFTVKPTPSAPRITHTSEEIMQSIARSRSLHLSFSNICADLSMNDQTKDTLNPYVVVLTQPMIVAPLKRSNATKQKSMRSVTLNTATLNTLVSFEDAVGKQRRFIRMQNKLWPCTSIKKRNLKPSWSNEKDLHVAIDESITSAEQLVGSFLYITFFHADSVMDQIIGTAVFHLYKLVSEECLELSITNEPLLKNGKVQGFFSCQLEIWWFAKSITSRLRRPHHKGCCTM